MKLLTHIKSNLISYVILTAAIALTGCGGGGGGSSKSSTPASSKAVSSTPIDASSTPVSAAPSSTPAVSSSLSSSSNAPILSSSSSSIMVSSSSVASSAAALTGLFIDSAVAGIHYQTSPGGFSGKTSSSGEYEYVAGDSVVFSIGDLTLPAVMAKDIVTPLDIANSTDPENQIALNIAALLQSLDIDGDPDNGISIDYETAASSAQSLNFDQTYEAFAALPAVTNLVAASGSSVTALVSKSSALTHLQTSLGKVNTAPLIGTWSLQSNDFRYILFILDSSRYAQLIYDGGGATLNYGTYSWDSITKEVTIESTEVAGTEITKAPFPGTMSINGDALSLEGWFGKFELSRLTSTTNPLIGGWSSVNGNNLSVFAYTDTHYFQGQNGKQENEYGKPGAEYGTYSNSDAGFTVETLADTNLQWGFSHPCNIVDTHVSQAANDYSCLGSGDKSTLTVSGNILDAYSAANVIANKTNAPPRNNEPEHFYFNRVMKNEVEIFGLPNPLNGRWTLNGDTFIFTGDNQFTHVKAFGIDPNCGTGIATGTYTWDATTFAFNVNLSSDSTAIEEGDSCSVGGVSKLILSGNTLTLVSDSEYIFTKNTSASAGLVGTWTLKSATAYSILTFTDTAYFLSDYDSSGTDDAPIYGSESGTYTYTEGVAKFTVLVDNNGTRGFSDNSNSNTPWPIGFSSDGDSFTIGDDSVLKRLK